MGPKIVDVVPEMKAEGGGTLRSSGHVVDGEESHLGGIGEEEGLLGDESYVNLEALGGVSWFTCFHKWGWTLPGPLILSFDMSGIRTGDAIRLVDVSSAEGKVKVPVSGDLGELLDADVAHSSLIFLDEFCHILLLLGQCSGEGGCLVVGWLAGEGVKPVFRLEYGGVALFVNEGDGVEFEVVFDVAAVWMDILEGEEIRTCLGGEADWSEVEKVSLLGAPDGRSLRVYPFNPSDLFGGSEVGEMSGGTED